MKNKKEIKNPINQETSLQENEENLVITNDDFEYVQMDQKIHDVKFHDKPTTFLKDALKRFVKNKSSVVAATILGILILTSFIVPLVITNDTQAVDTALAFLPPRWPGFENAGFLNGTISHSDIPYDEVNQTPVDFKKEFIVGEIKTYEAFISTPHSLARGGSVGLHGDEYNVKAGFRSDKEVTFDIKNEYEVEFVLDKYTFEWELTDFSIYFNEIGEESTAKIPVFEITTDDLLTKKDSDVSFKTSLNEALINSGLTGTSDSKTGYFSIELPAISSGEFPIIFIKKLVTTNVKDANDKTFENVDFANANYVMLMKTWRNMSNFGTQIDYSAVSSLYNATLTYCSFVYDKYSEVFGNYSKILTINDINKYASLGYISINYPNGEADKSACTIEILDKEKCPIVELTDYNYFRDEYLDLEIQEFTCVISKYRELGYTSMPYFIFGTNSNGQDFFKMVFEGLRTSLLLGFACAAINIFIGIVWGAVSGYFGGYTDLLMERFTDILGGMPWIVVMTLCVLHLGGKGADFFVFLLALCLTGWIGTASSMRSQMYRYKGREYVLASRTLGARDGRLIFRHILPNAIGPIVTSGVLMIPGIIFSEATIAYLGLGLKGFQSLGVLLSNAQEYIQTNPYLIICSSLIVAIIMIAFNLFGNGLRDAFNPSLKGAE